MNNSLFRIKKPTVTSPEFRAYWIESTAPLNVDDTDEKPPVETLPLVEMDPDQAIADIAAYLNGCADPQIVISVHGFNNPFPVVEKRFEAAYEYLTGDQAIKDSPGLVCIGYRWPSEAMFSPAKSVFSAAPRGLLWAFGIAIVLIALGIGFSTPLAQNMPHRNLLHGLFYFMGSVFAAVPFTTFLERAAVYFRDGYRAVNYGVPDLLEVLRHLDKVADADQSPNRIRPKDTRIKLSFIGHSMGAFVVTNLVRILSDVFDPATMTTGLANSASPQAAPQSIQPESDTSDLDAMRRIGNVYILERLILVSPDIPAENLLQGRANFLQSSMRRFREAYLFSNEGDEALRLISTVANYFSFPTQDCQNGYRLGNVDVTTPLQPSYGIVNLPRLRSGSPVEAQQFLDELRVGQLTLNKLSAKVVTSAGTPADGSALPGSNSPLPALFTYFDCTDYVDVTPSGARQAIMTFAKCKARLSDWDHFMLLCSYLGRQTPDVHSGYFYHPFSQCLIYRLACLGLSGLLASPPPGSPASQGLDAWSSVCQDHQIQVLLSPVRYAPLVGTSLDN